MEKFKKWYHSLSPRNQTLVWIVLISLLIPIIFAIIFLPALFFGVDMYLNIFLALIFLVEPVPAIVIIMVLLGIFKDYEMQFACGIYFGGFFVTRLLRAYIHGTSLYVISYGILILICVVIWQRIKLNKKEDK